MIKVTEIKKALIQKLKQCYPEEEYKYYGMEVKEGYKKPSFFVEIRLNKIKDETANTVSKDYSIYITYFQKKLDEMDSIEKAEKIQEILCEIDEKKRLRNMTLKVNDRILKVEDYSYEYIGEQNNILQIEFHLFFYDFSAEKDQYQIVNVVEIKE